MTPRRTPVHHTRHRDPEWMADAHCKTLIATGELTVDDFFPLPGQNAWRAKAACAACPVWQQCRAYALSTREIHGVWGATTEADRRRLRRRQVSA